MVIKANYPDFITDRFMISLYVFLKIFIFFFSQVKGSESKAESKEQKEMALEEKPGVKSSSSIVPCFLFVEVSSMVHFTYYVW